MKVVIVLISTVVVMTAVTMLGVAWLMAPYRTKLALGVVISGLLEGMKVAWQW